MRFSLSATRIILVAGALPHIHLLPFMNPHQGNRFPLNPFQRRSFHSRLSGLCPTNGHFCPFSPSPPREALEPSACGIVLTHYNYLSGLPPSACTRIVCVWQGRSPYNPCTALCLRIAHVWALPTILSSGGNHRLKDAQQGIPAP